MNCTCSLNSVLAWLGWALAIIIEVAAIAAPYPPGRSVAILFAAAGATLHVRGMIYGLASRERNAFDLGRESMRSVR